MKTAVIIPTYNERKNIVEIVPAIFKHVPDAEIFVVDDNSPDGTGHEVVKMQKEFHHLKLIKRHKKEGLGKAYIHAFKEVLKEKGVEVLIMMDADFSHSPEYLWPMMHELSTVDVVVGSRYVRSGGTIGWEMWRKGLSMLGNLYCRVITGLPVNDATAGFNVIKTEYLRKIDLDKLNSSGYAFQIELKCALKKVGARFFEYPIVFTNRREGESKISNHIIREGLLAPWKIRFKK